MSYDDRTIGLEHAWRSPAGWLTGTVDTGGGKTSSLALDPDPPHAPRLSSHHQTTAV
jgi:hypothetical protein